MEQIVFWQRNLSIHQSALIRALSGSASYDVTLITQDELPSRRKEMGWSAPDLGTANLIRASEESNLDSLISTFSTDRATHIFSGIHAYPMIYQAFRRVARTDSTLGILSEAGTLYGARSHLSLLRNRFNAIRFRNRIAFVLAIGRLGVDWYIRSGFPASKVFEFAYFLDEGFAGHRMVCADHPFTFVFVGRLYPLKGVDLLLQALKGLEDRDWRLQVVGDGPETAGYRRLAERYFPAERVSWLGFLPNDEVRQVLRDADALVLPSRGDGWGAVISEALLAGTRVVCSDRCGAAVLVDDPRRGCVVQADSVESLRDGLGRTLDKGRISAEERRAIAGWASRITGTAGATYLDTILRSVGGNGQRPTPPWGNGPGGDSRK